MRVFEPSAGFPLLPPETPPAAPPAPEAPLLDQLLEAGRDADEATLVLEAAQQACDADPTAPNMERVRRAAARAMEREVRFAALWATWSERNLSARP